MGRKRNTAIEQQIKAKNRKRKAEKAAIRGPQECPRCEKNTVIMRFTGTAHTANKIKGGLMKIKVGRVHCTECGESLTMGLMPSETLIDIYCIMYDKLVLEQRYIKVWGWLFDTPESGVWKKDDGSVRHKPLPLGQLDIKKKLYPTRRRQPGKPWEEKTPEEREKQNMELLEQ